MAGVSASAMRQKRKKSIEIRKEEMKLSLQTRHDFFLINLQRIHAIPKNLQNNFIKLINEVSKVAEYQIKTQYIYLTNKQLELEIKPLPCATEPKYMKYLCISVT